MNELVSVVIPVYNRAHLIKRTISSVLAQTYKNIEIIVVDDCSNDNIDEKINDIISSSEMPIKFVKNPKNMGVSFSRNNGIKMAEGKYVALLDSDDCYASDKIIKQLKIAQELNEKCFIFTNGVAKLNNGTDSFYNTNMCTGEVFIGRLGNPMINGTTPPSTWFFTRSIIEKVGLFDSDLAVWEDVDFSYRVYASGIKGYYLNEELVYSYQDEGEYLSELSLKSTKAKELFAQKHEKVFDRNVLSGVYKSLGKDYSHLDKNLKAKYYLKAFKLCPWKLEYLFKALR